jgi:peptidyl-prolyl cis-trans isomerase D
MASHQPTTARELNTVKADIISILQAEKAKQYAAETAKALKTRLQAGEPLATLAAEAKLATKNFKGLTRVSMEVPVTISDAIFKAAKPIAGKPSIVLVPNTNGEQTLVRLTQVNAGVMSDNDKKKLDLARKNISNAVGQAEFNTVLNSLQMTTDISITKSTPTAAPEDAE